MIPENSKANRFESSTSPSKTCSRSKRICFPDPWKTYPLPHLTGTHCKLCQYWSPFTILLEGNYNLFESVHVLVFIYFLQEIAEKNLRIIQNGLNTDDSAFGDQSLRTSLSFTKPTWLGPKTQQAKTIPPLPNLSF